MSLAGNLFYKIKNKIDNANTRRFASRIVKETVKLHLRTEDPEIKAIVEYYQSGRIFPFPYPFTNEYINRIIDVLFDDSKKLCYVEHRGLRLYFPREYSEEQIRKCYNGLCLEQDKESPHCYTQADFYIQSGDIVIDVGCADGLFSLENIEKIEHLYLFEFLPMWIEPLQATFEPWMKKVTIIKKLVSSMDSNESVSLDGYFKNTPIKGNLFLKIDVEGYEEEVIRGASKIIETSEYPIKIACATYHKHDDYRNISQIFNQKHFEIKSSKGYIVYYFDKNIKAPYIRRCVIYAKK